MRGVRETASFMMVWTCVGHVLDMFWVRFGCFGYVLDVLDMFWARFLYILDMCWTCLGYVLDIFLDMFGICFGYV